MGSTNSSNKFNIIICGAGIAGLTAAIGLQQKGHQVIVFERHADTQALGGALDMSPSATKILIQYGLKEKILSQLSPGQQPTYFRRYADGKNLGLIPPGLPEVMYGSPIWKCSRFGYQKGFRQVAEERGVKVEFSAPIEKVDVEKSAVTLRDGRQFAVGLIIGADGIGSVIRPFIAGDILERRNPVGAIKTDVPLSAMQDDPDLAVIASEMQNFWMGPGAAFAGGVIQDLGSYHGTLSTEDKFGAQGEWFVKGYLAQIAKKRKGWDPRILKVLKLVKPEDCYIWNITGLPSLPTWSKGNTVLIGDAAHAALPFMGVCATLGVEDGARLAECLDRAKTVDDIPRVLKAFENLRRARAESMIKFSRVVMNVWHLPDGEQQKQRDAVWSSLESVIAAKDSSWDGKPIDDPPKGFTDPLLETYFRGHDTVDFVSRSHVQNLSFVLTLIQNKSKVR